jgi:hypothetical protein
MIPKLAFTTTVANSRSGGWTADHPRLPVIDPLAPIPAVRRGARERARSTLTGHSSCDKPSAAGPLDNTSYHTTSGRRSEVQRRPLALSALTR